jgi:two-component system, NtrC family, response regulator HupR/HoxA
VTARPVVLVVDDEPLNRDLLRRVLYRDYQIIEAADADAALAVIDARAVDAVLCDQVMPGRSGTDLAREVRRRAPRVVILLLTGYEDAPEVARAIEDRTVDAVIGKPWVPAYLKDILVRAVEKIRATP